MNTYYQVVYKESGDFYILEDKIPTRPQAEFIMNDFLALIDHIDGNFHDIKIYEITEK